ncbi:UxaA family hydrolase [Bacillus sp. ISL-34]|uniref:UxaA family hydrolase n=1 Tax=Bacillus sp. ISL-34 TaxID=2819121 RepID=UPI001BECC1A0|nr:UxaA family hydrolase [Bacillus sp. ISL-34]MBT2645340.1 UxaA family hydrolase [Bacillus sp. ISL-34]
MTTLYRTVMMQPNDNVATALTNIPADNLVHVSCQGKVYEIKVKDDIEFGHKFAVVAIEAGNDVFKYGEVIGISVKDIEVGEHVHIHNVDGKRGRGDKTNETKSTMGL